MEIRQVLYLLLTGFIRQLPQFIVLITGIALCFSNRAKYPKASRIALGGLFILLITDLIGIAIFLFQVYLPFWTSGSAKAFGYINFAVGIVFSIISAGGLGLIIYAVWTERDK